MDPVRRCALTVEKSRRGQNKPAGTNRGHPPGVVGRIANVIKQTRRRQAAVIRTAHDERVINLGTADRPLPTAPCL